MYLSPATATWAGLAAGALVEVRPAVHGGDGGGSVNGSGAGEEAPDPPPGIDIVRVVLCAVAADGHAMLSHTLRRQLAVPELCRVRLQVRCVCVHLS